MSQNIFTSNYNHSFSNTYRSIDYNANRKNRVLRQVQNVQKQTDVAQEDELRRLTELEAVTNVENTTYRDRNGQTALVPAGFAVSQVEGENVIEQMEWKQEMATKMKKVEAQECIMLRNTMGCNNGLYMSSK